MKGYYLNYSPLNLSCNVCKDKIIGCTACTSELICLECNTEGYYISGPG